MRADAHVDVAVAADGCADGALRLGGGVIRRPLAEARRHAARRRRGIRRASQPPRVHRAALGLLGLSAPLLGATHAPAAVFHPRHPRQGGRPAALHAKLALHGEAKLLQGQAEVGLAKALVPGKRSKAAAVEWIDVMGIAQP
eukprot:6208794-Pleurochrysis_carterae.AAC.3